MCLANGHSKCWIIQAQNIEKMIVIANCNAVYGNTVFNNSLASPQS